MSFTCPDCKLISHNPTDEAMQYCGNCHKFFADVLVVDPADVDHVVENILRPQQLGAELRAEGVDVEVAPVNVSPDATEGFEVTCISCGRTARLSFDPGVKVALCPRCQP